MVAFNQTSIETLELPDFETIPAGMPWAFDNTSVALSLGIRTRTLMHLILSRNTQYTEYKIPKKSGGTRVIHAPNRMLKYVQGKLLERYLNVLEYPEHIAAYVPGRTTRFSAEQHTGKKILIVMDLKDFFTNTRRSWVRQVFHHHFHYSHYVSSLLADMCTLGRAGPLGMQHFVPQGAPTSGAVCNWVAHYRIDNPILDICKKWEMDYSRYADDLAFSSNKLLDRREANRFVREITQTVKKGGYRVNYKKLRVTRYNKQQRLLGMTVNEKPNIIRVHYRKLRARLHHCKHDGFDKVATEMGLESGDQLESQIAGMISYYHMINPEKAAKLKQQLESVRNGPLLSSV